MVPDVISTKESVWLALATKRDFILAAINAAGLHFYNTLQLYD